MAQLAQKIALVTGGNQGIGLAMCQQLVNKQFRVLMGSRNVDNAKKAIETNFKANATVEPLQLDLCDPKSIAAAAKSVETNYKSIDVLINNAGMAFKGSAFDENVFATTNKTNYFGTMDVTNAFLPLVKKGGRIIFVSSRASHSAFRGMSKEHKSAFMDDKLTIDGVTKLLSQFQAAVAKDKDNIRNYGWPQSAYGMSKVGVSMYAKILAQQMKDKLWIGGLCPGYVSTNMSSYGGNLTPAQGAWPGVELAARDLDNNLPTGCFWVAVFEDKNTKLVKHDWFTTSSAL